MERMIPIAGLDGQYSITDTGRVFSHKTNKYLRPSDNGHGYSHVCMCVNGRPIHRYLHRLVAEAFVPNPDNLPEVNHIDENTQNNTPNNLEWCTSKYNKNYGNRAKKFSVSRGRPVLCIETETEYHAIREASRKTGINASDIYSCCSGYRNVKTAGGYHWMYCSSIQER